MHGSIVYVLVLAEIKSVYESNLGWVVHTVLVGCVPYVTKKDINDIRRRKCKEEKKRAFFKSLKSGTGRN
jgi:hypothetical protein